MAQESARWISTTRRSAATSEAGWYLYAITRPPSNGEFDGLPGMPAPTGAPRPVEVVTKGSIAALVTQVSEARVRPKRCNLAAHNNLLKQLMERDVPFLPVAFGIIAPGRKGLERLLTANRSDLERELGRLQGKVEMGLKITWEVDNIFAFFVTQYPELAEHRDRVLAQPAGASRDDMIDLGQRFEGLLKHAREQYVASVKRALGGCVVEFTESEAREEKTVLKISCLIPRSGEKAFEQTVVQLASGFDDHFAFDYNGPWPPFSFVDVALKTDMFGSDRKGP